MVQQGRDLFGRIQARSSGGLHHDARVVQNLLFGTLVQKEAIVSISRALEGSLSLLQTSSHTDRSLTFSDNFELPAKDLFRRRGWRLAVAFHSQTHTASDQLEKAQHLPTGHSKHGILFGWLSTYLSGLTDRLGQTLV